MFSETNDFYSLYDNLSGNMKAVEHIVNNRLSKTGAFTDKLIVDMYKHHIENETLDSCVAALSILVEDDDGMIVHGVENPVLFINAEKILYGLGLIPKRELYNRPIMDYREELKFRKVAGHMVPVEVPVLTTVGLNIKYKYESTLSGSSLQNNKSITIETMGFLMDVLFSILTCVQHKMKFVDYMKTVGVNNYVDLSSH